MDECKWGLPEGSKWIGAQNDDILSPFPHGRPARRTILKGTENGTVPLGTVRVRVSRWHPDHARSSKWDRTIVFRPTWNNMSDQPAHTCLFALPVPYLIFHTHLSKMERSSAITEGNSTRVNLSVTRIHRVSGETEPSIWRVMVPWVTDEAQVCSHEGSQSSSRPQSLHPPRRVGPEVQTSLRPPQNLSAPKARAPSLGSRTIGDCLFLGNRSPFMFGISGTQRKRLLGQPRA